MNTSWIHTYNKCDTHVFKGNERVEWNELEISSYKINTLVGAWARDGCDELDLVCMGMVRMAAMPKCFRLRKR